MYDAQELLKRQAEWQASRSRLSWGEKIRLAERIRDDIRAIKSPHRRHIGDHPPSPRTA